MSDTVRIKTEELEGRALDWAYKEASAGMEAGMPSIALVGNRNARRRAAEFMRTRVAAHHGDYADVPRELVEER